MSLEQKDITINMAMLLLFAAEMRNFRRNDLSTTFVHLAFALSARPLTTTSG